MERLPSQHRVNPVTTPTVNTWLTDNPSRAKVIKELVITAAGTTEARGRAATVAVIMEAKDRATTGVTTGPESQWVVWADITAAAATTVAVVVIMVVEAITAAADTVISVWFLNSF